MNSKFIPSILLLSLVISRVHVLVLKKQNPYLDGNNPEELAESKNIVESRKLTIVHDAPSIKHCKSMEGHNFFLIIIASFIGALIGLYLKNLFSSRSSSGIQRRLSQVGSNKKRRKVNRMLAHLNSKIHRGESKMIKYVNSMLLDPHKVHIKQRKLIGEVMRVRKYLDDSGFELPEHLTERNLYQITKNVFWNLHQFNLDSKGNMAKKIINTLYSHREPVFTIFTDAINGI